MKTCMRESVDEKPPEFQEGDDGGLQGGAREGPSTCKGFSEALKKGYLY